MKFNQLIKDEDFHSWHIYNAEEIALFWQPLLRNNQKLKNDYQISDKINSKDSLLSGSVSTHLLKPMDIDKAMSTDYILINIQNICTYLLEFYTIKSNISKEHIIHINGPPDYCFKVDWYFRIMLSLSVLKEEFYGWNK